MRSRFDQFAKHMLREALAPAGLVETDAEVSPDAQRVDVWFVPDPAKRHDHQGFGLLSRLTERACLLEPFHSTPGPDELVGCLRKLLAFQHVLSLRAPSPPSPRMWVISSGRPASGLTALGFRPLRDWPRGLYTAAPALHFGLLVVSELPRTRDTLLLRLMGAGRVLKRAIADLRALPEATPERDAALPVLLRLRLDAPPPDARTADDQEFMMSTEDVVEVWKRQVFEEGHQEGVEQQQAHIAQAIASARHVFMLLYEVRFGRMPRELQAIVKAAVDPQELTRWSDLAAHGEQAQVNKALLASKLAAKKPAAARPRASASKARAPRNPASSNR
jgi:hypothetical protein